MERPHSLYICYFGIREPLVQTQVLPYLREIRKGGVDVSILTFEPQPGEWENDVRNALAGEGIDWHSLKYHKRFSVLATAYDVLRGTMFVRGFISRHKPAVLHGRIHVPTLMAALGRKLSSHKPKLLFDIRGFFPEEYTDAGVWPADGLLYRSVKKVERWLLKQSDGFVVLTNKARDILFPEAQESGTDQAGRPVEVIPCCVDLGQFRSVTDEERREMREKLGIGDRTAVAYVGSFGGWYLTDEMMDFFASARDRDPNTFVLVLTQRDQERVRAALLARGLSEQDFLVGSVRPAEIPEYLNAADVAISFIKACYSKRSSSPTKIAEYLACGLPVISNRGIGDLDELIDTRKVGALLDGFTPADYKRAMDDVALRRTSAADLREIARQEFDLEQVAGVRYRRIYSRLLGR